MSLDPGILFLGRGWAFPPRFRHDGVLAMSSDERDIRESLQILLSTTPGERIMHPAFGCGLRALVFESLDESLKTRIRDTVVRAVARFEQRVELDLVAVHGGELHAEGLLKIELNYRIRATNAAGNLVFPFYLANGQDAPAGGAP